ncbi:hypothetical protein LTR37_012280 [Vermiconidia calcicola]|uniref:Uncharacterized protein n=1 Tax=Vermiconidia calcicola TaxID=1690605 RepID=A0ACC3N121_9PEZI|nr:hypothetical protein LTR37_012280 [Vermiconidia calcicola]
MAIPNPMIKGPGLLYVQSRIERQDVLDEETFFKWYDEDHISEIVDTPGMKSAFRYRAVDFEERNKKKEKPYLAFYPMQDMAFTQGDEFRNIKVKSPLLPETGIIYDLAEMDVRYLSLVQKTEPMDNTNSPSSCLVVFGIEPGPDVSDEEAEKWFKEEHIPRAGALEGYIRTTFYHLQYARTNAQSRALKGLPTTDAPAPEPPTFLALHEFGGVVDFPTELDSTPNAQKMLRGAKQVERVVYRLAKGLGTQWFFN